MKNDKRNEMNKILKKYWYIPSLILLVPVCLFLIKFNPIRSGFSNNISDWGNFGSYIGGTLGLLIAAANLIVFVILTNEVTKINDSNNERNLKFEQIKILTDFRHESITRYENVLGELTNQIGDLAVQNHDIDDLKKTNKHIGNRIIWEIYKVQMFFNSYLQTYVDIFPEMNGKDLSADIEGLVKYYMAGNANKEQLKELLTSYTANYTAFLNQLRQTTIKEINNA